SARNLEILLIFYLLGNVFNRSLAPKDNHRNRE
ncbi:uncharacterized protein METZ01_LOCUS494565, partial [marine metagenome]